MSFYYTPYLNFDGDAEVAFELYQRAFNGIIQVKQKFSDTSYGDDLPENEKNRIMHISMVIAPGYSLMATDILPSKGQVLHLGNNQYISLNASSENEAQHWFDLLSEEGQIEMPLQKTDWGALFAIFTDRHHIRWMINYDFQE